MASKSTLRTNIGFEKNFGLRQRLQTCIRNLCGMPKQKNTMDFLFEEKMEDIKVKLKEQF